MPSAPLDALIQPNSLEMMGIDGDRTGLSHEGMN